jgi:hypothetical protein
MGMQAEQGGEQAGHKRRRREAGRQEQCIYYIGMHTCYKEEIP